MVAQRLALVHLGLEHKVSTGDRGAPASTSDPKK